MFFSAKVCQGEFFVHNPIFGKFVPKRTHSRNLCRSQCEKFNFESLNCKYLCRKVGEYSQTRKYSTNYRSECLWVTHFLFASLSFVLESHNQRFATLPERDETDAKLWKFKCSGINLVGKIRVNIFKSVTVPLQKIHLFFNAINLQFLLFYFYFPNPL